MEGLPYTIMETMYAGVPVVATDVAGSQDFVDHARTGLLAPHGDVFGLCAALERLLTDADYAATISRNAREDVLNRFSLRDMVRNTADIYRQLAGADASV